MVNPIASALGKLAKGKPKKISQAERKTPRATRRRSEEEKMAKEITSNTPWPNGWIDAREQQPQPNQAVLTYSKDCGYVVGTYGKDGKWDATFTDNESGEPWLRDEGTVTHWMPLPAAPYPHSALY